MAVYMACKQYHVHGHPNVIAHNEESLYVGSVETVHCMLLGTTKQSHLQHAGMHDSYSPAFIA